MMHNRTNTLLHVMLHSSIKTIHREFCTIQQTLLQGEWCSAKTGIAVTIQQWHYYKGNSVLYNTLLQGEWCSTKTATRGLLYNTIAIITWGVMYNTGDIFTHHLECSDHQAQSIFNQYFIVSKTLVTDAETWSELESLPAVPVVPRIRFYS